MADTKESIIPAKRIDGYTDRISVAPGERIRFMVSCQGVARYRADIVRLIHGDLNPAGPGFKEAEIASTVSGEYPGRNQPVRPGSHIEIDDARAMLNLSGAFSLHAFIMPTTPQAGRQGIVTRWRRDRAAGYALVLDESGRLALWLGDASGKSEKVAVEGGFIPWTWYSVGASYDPQTGIAIVARQAVVNSANSLIGRVAAPGQSAVAQKPLGRLEVSADAPFVIAGYAAGGPGARTVVEAHFNGKIEAPRVYSRALDASEFEALARGVEPDPRGLAARWDFAAEIGANGVPTDVISDRSGNGLNGRCVNMPARAMTGHGWTAREENYVHAPAQYGAIHFHDDDLEDAGWDADFEWAVPAGTKSDVYAVRLRGEGVERRVPFFIRPPRGTASARVAFLAPTASYMAYANFRISVEADVGQAILGQTPVLNPDDLYLAEHPEYGLSLYDLHSDMSGVCYSSRLRPILNMAPSFLGANGLWGLPADLDLVDWLNARGYQYDVVTDEDLHREGLALLRPYKVIVTGTHPEYWSGAMLDAMEEYLATGGRLMYLGGNGFYWVTTYHPEKPHLIEVRRGESGSRAWQARPGEYYHSTTGERGGLWRNRGRAPQKLVGVGFSAQGFDESSYYRRMSDSFDERVRFIFEGVGRDELVGNFGLVGGGAAGSEIDRYDLTLGTPPGAMLLAASEGHSDNYPHVVEEIMFMYPGVGGTQDPAVRADMVYFTTPGGGAVFSTGSISWCGSLSHNNYENNVSRITANVLERFMSDQPMK